MSLFENLPDSPDALPRESVGGTDGNLLTGTVDSVVFHNEENGYSILKVREPGTPKHLTRTVVGSLPTVNVGEDIKATGQWIEDRQWGRQFKADSISAAPPTSKEGIERFLGSGLVDGIGKQYARRLVEKFGVEVLQIIEKESGRLEEVDGIGKKRRELIKESWNQQRTIREVMVFLNSHGISTNRAQRIFKQYGENALEQLQDNPYQMAKDISGVGFKTADEIARQLGTQHDAPTRIAAGIDFVLKTAGDDGHCALPREELSAKASELLSVDRELIPPVIERMIKLHEVQQEVIADLEMIYPNDLRKAEFEVAMRLRGLARQPASHPKIDIEKALAWVEKETSISLADSQREAIAAAVKNRLLIITGGPGVGKTTIMNAVLRILTAKKVSPVLCAPTGRAAKRLSESTGIPASTIHRLLAFQPGRGFTKNAESPLKGDLFVVDETSMLDIRLMHRLLDALPPDAHLILVGDIDQLPSVGPGAVLRDAIESEVLPVVRLTQIFRQAGASQIITAAHSINEGHVPAIKSERDSDFYFIERVEQDKILDTIAQLVTERIPQKFGFNPLRDVQILSPMNRNSLGTRNLNAVLQNALNPTGEQVEKFDTIFREGDRVIQTRNNYDLEVFNGDIGVIRTITTDPVSIEVGFESAEGERPVKYTAMELDELQLAWAITIHKSQGSEFPVVIIPLATQHFVLLQRNLLYTAVTRGKKLVVIVGDPKALKIAVTEQKDRKRYTGLKWRLQHPQAPSFS